MGFTSAVVLGLSLALAFLAARKRCLEAGIVPPHSGWLRKRGIYYPAGGMIVCLVLTQGMAIWLGAWRWDDLAGGGVITLLTGLIVLLVMSFVRYWLHPEDAEYYGSVRRSMLPVLITVLVILGLIGKFQLGMAERAEIAKLNRLGEPALFVDNVKYTSAHKYQDYLKSLPHHGAL